MAWSVDSNIDSRIVRIVFRIYFVIAIALLALVGKACAKSAVKLQLLHRKAVSVTSMTGWLQGVDLLLTMVKLKKLPGNVSLGSIMVVGTIVSLVADIAVSGLVQRVQVPSRCPFGQGLVLSITQPGTFDVTPVNGQPYTVASLAQRTSLPNGGLVGIYWKVNGDPNFHAEPEDVIGNWGCANVNNDLTYDVDTSQDEVLADLVSRGYLYSNWVRESTANGLGAYTHLVAWSSSANDGDDTPFDIKASIDLTAANTDAKIMRSFHCTVSTDQVNEILSSIWSMSTLEQWVPGFQGGVYDGSGTPASANASAFIEAYLNSMVMVQGGSNNLLNVPTGDSTQGCLVPKTQISIVVVALALVAALGLIINLCYWIVTLLRIRSKRRLFRPGNTGQDPVSFIPDDLLSWMLQAARECCLSGQGANNLQLDVVDTLPKETRHLSQWGYSLQHGGSGSSIARLQKSNQSRPRLNHLDSAQDGLVQNADRGTTYRHQPENDYPSDYD